MTWAGAAALLEAPSTVHSDCLNVARDVREKPPQVELRCLWMGPSSWTSATSKGANTKLAS
eukprot:9119793-Lingulodinium_polyedra.AAC.1